MADEQPETPFEAWQLRTNGFNTFGKDDELITPAARQAADLGGRPSVGQARGNEKATARKLVTGLAEIKQLALAEGNGRTDFKRRGVKQYNEYLIEKYPERRLENSCCWLCGKPFYEEPLGNPKHLGYLEVEHALPLKLGYMLLTIPGEITYDEKGKATPKLKYTDVEKSEIGMEILRSHRLCNNLKSNINFFKYTGDKGWEIKKDLVDTFEERLTELQEKLNENEETTHTQTIRCNPNGTTQVGTFVGVNNYSAKVNEAKLNAIVKRLNEKFQNFTVEQLAGKISEKVYLEVNEQQRNAYALSLIQYFNKNVEVTTEEETQTINENYTIILEGKETEKENKSSKLSTVPEDQVVDQASQLPAPAGTSTAGTSTAGTSTQQKTPKKDTFNPFGGSTTYNILEDKTLDVLIEDGIEYFNLIQNDNISQLQRRINNLRNNTSLDKIKRDLRIEIAEQLLNKLLAARNLTPEAAEAARALTEMPYDPSPEAAEAARALTEMPYDPSPEAAAPPSPSTQPAGMLFQTPEKQKE